MRRNAIKNSIYLKKSFEIVNKTPKKSPAQPGPSFLIIGLHDLPQRDMRVAIARMRIFLRDAQPDGQMRTGMHTSQTCLTLSRHKDRPSLLHMQRCRRTHMRADAAAGAICLDLDEMLPGI